MIDVGRFHDYLMSLASSVTAMALEIRAKGLTENLKGEELVTEADGQVENFLIRKLSEEFPCLSFHGEEGGVTNQNASEWRVYIDPIDGTMIFAAGMDYFGISVALAQNHEPVVGWIIFPDREVTISAIKGQGVCLGGERSMLSNASPISAKPLSECLVSCDYGIKGGARQGVPDAIDRYFKPVARYVRYVVLRACFTWTAYEVILGKLDAYVHPGVGPYDLAAAILIAKESGRAVGPIDPKGTIDLTQDVIPVIIARDEATLVSLQEILRH